MRDMQADACRSSLFDDAHDDSITLCYVQVTASVKGAAGDTYSVSQLTDQNGLARLILQTPIVDCSTLDQVSCTNAQKGFRVCFCVWWGVQPIR